MEGLISIMVLAGISEAVWETLKMTWNNGKIHINKLGSILVAMLLCVATKANILSIAGFNVAIPYLGEILTGLLISRGANFINDFYESINNLQKNTKTKKDG
jgi:hypothetical protein